MENAEKLQSESQKSPEVFISVQVAPFLPVSEESPLSPGINQSG